MSNRHKSSQAAACSQEPRLIKLETLIEQTTETLKGLTDLLTASIRAEEQIREIRRDTKDHEERIRKTETQLASTGWLDKVAWMALAALVTYCIRGALV